MPCSCSKKVNSRQSIYKPSAKAYAVTYPYAQYSKVAGTAVNIASDSSVRHQQASHFIPQQDIQLQSDSSPWDFSATVKPNQLCLYCAAKHIAYASVLLQSRTVQDTVAAAGQLMLASSHYLQYDTFASAYCKSLAFHIVRDMPDDLQWRSQLETLMLYAANPDQGYQLTPFWNYHDSPVGIHDASQIQIPFIHAILNMAAAFSLLFTEIGYLQINKNYAVGYLNAAASIHLPGYLMYTQNKQHKYNMQKIRQLWKIIQIMSPDSDQYYQCRYRMQTLMHKYIAMYLDTRQRFKQGRLTYTIKTVPRVGSISDSFSPVQQRKARHLSYMIQASESDSVSV